jgi:hypothetical protein
LNKLKYWFKLLSIRWQPPGHFNTLAPGGDVLVLWQGREQEGLAWKGYLEAAGHKVVSMQWDDRGKPVAFMPDQWEDVQQTWAALQQPLLISNFRPSKGLAALLLQSIALSGWVLVGQAEQGAASTFVWAGPPDEPAEPYLWITQLNQHETISI